jgi:twitching motility protein PilT
LKGRYRADSASHRGRQTRRGARNSAGANAVANLIREGKTFQLPSQMQVGKSMGMLTMNDSIMEYVNRAKSRLMRATFKAVDKAGLLDSYAANGIEYEPGDVKE